MKKLNWIAFIVISLCVVTSCTKTEDQFSDEVLLTRDARPAPDSFCDDAQTSNYSNGHQSRSFVEVNWSFFLDSPNPPGLINFHVEFQEGYSLDGMPVYGTVYEFTHTYISTVTDITERYSSLEELDGAVQGRWRVRVENCEWSDWISYYF